MLIPATGYSQPPPSTASPGPGKGRPARGPPGPATPQQSQPAPYPDPRASPQVRPTPPPSQTQNLNVGNVLADLEPDRLPANQKREGPDWFAVFNPRVPRTLDVDLVHTLQHESVVCCVRFSQDGHYVATGCNRSAQIFDVKDGRQVSFLQDESVDKDGDLYIRSVCFSPDGNYLATGAEDKMIRVSHGLLDETLHGINNTRYGILRLVLSSTHSLDTSKIYTPWILLAMGDTLLRGAVTERSASGTSIPAGKYSTLVSKMA